MVSHTELLCDTTRIRQSLVIDVDARGEHIRRIGRGDHVEQLTGWARGEAGNWQRVHAGRTRGDLTDCIDQKRASVLDRPGCRDLAGPAVDQRTQATVPSSRILVEHFNGGVIASVPA